MESSTRFRLFSLILWFGLPWCLAWSQTSTTESDQVTVKEVSSLRETVIRRGADYLLNIGRRPNGSFSEAVDPGVTALCVTALLRSGHSPEEEPLRESLQYLSTFVQSDGGIYRQGSYYQNYETCVSMLAFQAANEDGRYDRLLQRAAAFARSIQWDESEGIAAHEPIYGGAGYGRHKRPDLSNTQFFIEALRAQETEGNQEAIARALQFVSRCQNLPSPHNPLPVARKNPDGGFYYTPAAGGVSEAGETETGGLRSYGSMTYAGLKSLIYAGLSAEDPRVKAALGWIQQNYTLRENPGLADAGLYYYFHTFAKTLDALGQPTFVDGQGQTHDWRAELIQELARRQQPNGSWVNPNLRWMEGDANLVTAYALLALSHCRAP